jgi:hypothetical protein
MTRSNAKDLALDSLTDGDKAELARERDQLSEQFRDDPPPATSHRLDREIAQSSASLDNADERRALLQDSRDSLPWYRRRERAELKGLLERNAREIEKRTEHHHRRLAEHIAASDAELGWLQAHGPDAERLLTVDHELRARDHIDTQVTRSIERFHNGPAPLDRGLEPPGPGFGRDLGDDLGMGP